MSLPKGKRLMKRTLLELIEKKTKKKVAQAVIDEELHKKTSKTLKKLGLNWRKFITAQCKDLVHEYGERKKSA